MTAFTEIVIDIDYDKDGKQVSSLRVVQSRHPSGWRTVLVPVAVIKNGGGPTLLITGGVHGDECEGPVASMKLVRALRPEDVSGRVIVLPAANYPAVEADQRTSPVDGYDLNRCFPGKADGTITEMIAHYIDTVLLPKADLVLDIHSGGSPMSFMPCLWINELKDRSLMERTLAASRAFAPPLVLMTSPMASGAMSDSAERLGKVYLSTEVAGCGTVSPTALEIVETGTRNLLAHLGIAGGGRSSSDPSPAPRFMHVPSGDRHVLASDHGILEPLCELGDGVEAGQPLARIHRIEHPGEEALEVLSPCAGTLFGRRWRAHVNRGDRVALIAEDLDAS